MTSLESINVPGNQEVLDGHRTLPLGTVPSRDSALGTPILRVFGVGGGGCNAVARMCRHGLGVVEYYGVNTDAQHLDRSHITHRVPVGQQTARGLGVGGYPEMGRQAAEESRDELAALVAGADMVFIAAGMGGGTGTGASPIVAQLAKESGALTVAVVTKPFSFESAIRRQHAEAGIAALREQVDTLIVIPNDRLLHLDNNGSGPLTWEGALELADSVLLQGIQAIAEVVTVPGEINVDFADVKAIMSDAGPAWLAIGSGAGERRAVEAAQAAVKSPLLDIVLEGAGRILFVITGGHDLTLKEVQQAADVIQDVADPDANIIFGTCKDPAMEDEVKVTMIASAFPIAKEAPEDRQEELQRLLQQTPTDVTEELDVPSFLRKQANHRRKRGLFR